MIKTRIQTQRTTPVLTVRQTAADVYRTSGLRGFYRGLWPTLLRAAPANALCFVGLETTLRVLGCKNY